MAANIDRVFVVSALSEDLNQAKLERYLTIGWESGALPVVLLTKSDLSPGPRGGARAGGGDRPRRYHPRHQQHHR